MHVFVIHFRTSRRVGTIKRKREKNRAFARKMGGICGALRTLDPMSSIVKICQVWGMEAGGSSREREAFSEGMKQEVCSLAQEGSDL